MDYMNEVVTARNTEDGTVGQYRRSVVDHPILGKYLEEVPFGSKPLVDLSSLVQSKFELPERQDVPEYTETKKEDD